MSKIVPDSCLKSINFGGPFKKAMKFLGVILIVNGLALCFAGSLYLFIALSGVAAFAILGIILGLSSNLNLITIDSKTYQIAIVVVVAVVLAGLGAYFSFVYTSKYASTIIAALCGVTIGVIITTMAMVRNNFIKAGVIVVLSILGAYIGKEFNKYVKSIGTAVVGALLIAIGGS